MEKKWRKDFQNKNKKKSKFRQKSNLKIRREKKKKKKKKTVSAGTLRADNNKYMVLTGVLGLLLFM